MPCAPDLSPMLPTFVLQHGVPKPTLRSNVLAGGVRSAIGTTHRSGLTRTIAPKHALVASCLRILPCCAARATNSLNSTVRQNKEETMHTESVSVDGPMELVAAMIKAAVHDLQRGPGLGKHYESAVTFLSDAGLLEIVQARLNRAHDLQRVCTPATDTVGIFHGCAAPRTMETIP